MMSSNVGCADMHKYRNLTGLLGLERMQYTFSSRKQTDGTCVNLTSAFQTTGSVLLPGGLCRAYVGGRSKHLRVWLFSEWE